MNVDYSQFVRHLLELASIIPAAVFAMLPVRNLLRFSRRMVFPLGALAIVVAIGVGALICAYFHRPSVLVAFALMPVLLSFYAYIVDINAGKTLFCSLFAAILAVVGRLVAGFINAPVEAANPNIAYLPHTSLLCLAVDVVLLAAFLRSLTVKIPMLLTEEDLDGSWGTASLGAAIILLILVWITPADYAMMLRGRLQLISLIAVILFTLMLILLIDVVWKLASHLVENTRLRERNNMLVMEEQRYEQLADYMSKTRELRHDFRQHLRVISGFARDGQIDDLNEYLDELESQVEHGFEKFCANRAVDAVAAYYDGVAEKQGASIDWSLMIPEDVFIKETDLCSVLGNLVENALQAVSVLPEEQHVTVQAQLLSEEMLGVGVRNPYKGKIRLSRDGLPRTNSKEVGHGIGLASVKATVERYEGSFDIDTEDGIFSVNILMYAPDENKNAEQASA